MNKVTDSKLSRKTTTNSNSASESSDDEARCNARIVRSKSTSRTLKTCNKRDSGSQIVENDKSNSSLLKSGSHSHVGKSFSKPVIPVVIYVDAFENEVADDVVDDEQTETLHSSPSNQNRADDKFVRGDRLHETQEKANNDLPTFQPIAFDQHRSLDPNLASEQVCLTSRPAEKMLLMLGKIDESRDDPEIKKHKYNRFIKEMNTSYLTNMEQEEFIKKISPCEPFFEQWNWTTKSMIHHKLERLGLFYEITEIEEIKYLQIKLIKSLISNIITQCTTSPESINDIGLSGLLHDVIKITDDREDKKMINVHNEHKNMVVELMTVVASKEIRMTANSIGGSMYSIGRFITNKMLAKSDLLVINAVDAFFGFIVEEIMKFKYFQIKNILISMRVFFEMKITDHTTNNGMHVVILLLPYLYKGINRIEQIDKKQIMLSLGLISYLRNKAFSEERCHFNKLINTLVRAIPRNVKDISYSNAANMLYSLATVLETCVIKEDSLFFMKTATLLIPAIEKNVERFDSPDICTLIRSFGLIIGANPKAFPELNDAFVMLLNIVPQKIGNVALSYVSFVLLGIKSAVTNIELSEELINNISEIFYLTLSCLRVKCSNFSIRNAASMLNSYGSLAEHCLIKERSNSGKYLKLHSLKWAVSNLLNFILEKEKEEEEEEEEMNALSINKVLQNITHSLLHIQNISMKLATNVYTKFINLLILKTDKIDTKMAYSLIISLGTSMTNGVEWTKKVEQFACTLLDIIHKDIKKTNKGITTLFPHQISNMLFSLSLIGLRLKNLKYLLLTITQNNTLLMHIDMKNKISLLSALTYFYSWYDEEKELKHNLSKEMKTLIEQIDRENLKSKLATTNSSFAMASAKFWLGIEIDHDNISEIDKPTSSIKHQMLLSKLRERYTSYNIQSEVSIKGLSPVDIIFLDIMFIMEVDGKHHYLNNDERILDGRSISKMKAYIRMGCTVMRVHVEEIDKYEKLGYTSLYDDIDDHIKTIKTLSGSCGTHS